ncbi:RidA family protein [Pseudochelatococcus contaminans]|uniref:Enamine deaminase RidA (YjgF/YER057c/UK114 family) n=1 Tax=Pseudochelatococcus contaminans TaxID=1538103 RepID=A0A7W6EGW7_9HYPH|nr:RidA family protein [Pseudochelatococcus contaminans]MBB3809690.1 enamine deaminase RidA (YjgF/YER057c/UK114 family) [Pseudochelatococcus contaminans]
MSIQRLKSGPRMSQAVIHNGIVYLAGQVGTPGKDTETQTREVLASIDDLLGLAGTNRSRILQATVWLADMADFDVMNGVWEEWTGGKDTPARATGEVRLATPEYKVEIIVVAALP